MRDEVKRVLRKIKYYRRNKKFIVNKRQDVSYYGSEYGGFAVCRSLLDKKDAIVYSFGIGEDLSFSEEIMNAFDVDIFAYDPTPKSIEYVMKHMLLKNERFHFEGTGLSDTFIYAG